MKYFNAKTLLLGDGAVGKTSLIKQYVKNEFEADYKPTIGVDIFSKSVKFENVQINMSVWDIAGQEKFKLFRKSFFSGAHAALVIFDYTRLETFNSLESEWITNLLEISGNVPYIIIGNKTDLEKQVDQEKINALTNKYGVKFIETSALNNTNVDEAFQNIAEGMLNHYKDI